jgi:NADH dehydrogenase
MQMHMNAASRPRVVIVGAGFGGLEAARRLSSAALDITIVDRRNFHLFQPLLYQVATAALSPGDIAWPIRSIFHSRPNVRVLMAEVEGVDSSTRTVQTPHGPLPYDYLIIATGAAHSYFGHDEWAQFAPGLKNIDDAIALRQRALLAFERAEREESPDERRKLMTTVIVGGGATGVEMAGAIAELDHRTLHGEFRHIDPNEARVVLVEAGQRLLPSFPEHMSAVGRRSLESMRVEVRTGVRVTDCSAAGVTLEGGEHIAAANIVWAAGVAASPAGRWLHCECDRAGRVVVKPDLSIAGHPEIFVIGDTASVSVDGKAVPGVAPAAKQMGHFVARLIVAKVKGRAPSAAAAAFRYKNQGDLAAIGRKSALVVLGRLKFSGLLGWLFWCVAHIFFLIGFRSRVVVAFNWIWSYLTSQRGARLIADRERA